MDDIAIRLDSVSKIFKLPHEKSTSIKSVFINVFRPNRGYEAQKALENISFDIKRGEFFGIIGRNGSGKSTLLKLLAGIYIPTKGSVVVNGKLTPFIELGVGFNPELTGRENVFLNGALLGFSRKEMRAMYEGIVEFAELEKFMDQKLKNYSSGMQVRLAFSIAIRAQSDILLIDEVLAVGDASFQQKCYDYFRELKENKQTVVFVSHDRSALEAFCSRCALIDMGRLIAVGPTSEILNSYNEITLERLAKGAFKSKEQNISGNKDIEVVKVEVDSPDAKYLPNKTIILRVDMKVNRRTNNPVFGLVLKNSAGEQVLTTNTKVEKIKTGVYEKGDKITATYSINNIFGNGKYSISPAIANEDATVFLDWEEAISTFVVAGWDDTYSTLHPPHKIKLERTS